MGCLEKQVTHLETTMAELKKAVKGATTSAATSANKVDELKKRIDALEKRLKKVEDKQ